MSWRIRIKHRTTYRYQGAVTSSYNEARLTPPTNERQTAIEARLEISPSVRPMAYTDYWGTRVHAFDVHTPHAELTVTGHAVVETAPPSLAGEPVTWDLLAAARESGAYDEVLRPTAFTAVDDGLADLAAGFAVNAADPAAAARTALDWVRDRLTYVPGSTAVTHTAMDAYAQREGVCQDFAHLGIGILRSMGVPARYVSGYQHPSADAGLGEQTRGESHAWVEYWTGSWRPHDVTNGIPVGERHVLVARGRDYADVPPVKGVYRGAAEHSIDVDVELTRVG